MEHDGKDCLFFMDAHAKMVEDRGLCGNDMSFETRTMKGIYGYGVRFKNDNGGLCFECVDDTGLQHPVYSEVLYLDGLCMCKVRNRETRKYGLADVSSGKLLHPFEYDGFIEKIINTTSFLYGLKGDDKVCLRLNTAYYSIRGTRS